MNDDQIFLANAYLDGEVTADERRIAEADPEVMFEVEQLRALHDELRRAPAPTHAARESAISAAMAVFGTAGAPGDADEDDEDDDERRHVSAPVVPFRPRPAYAKLLGIAAAVVAVAGLGIIVSQGTRDGDDDAADSAEPTLEAAAIERADAPTESVEDAAGAEIMADDGGGADSAADEATADEATADDGMGDDEFAAEPAAEATADASGEDTAEGAAEDDPTTSRYWLVPAGFDPLAPITNDVELGIYGAYLIGERDAGQLRPTPNHACTDAQQILDEATLELDDEIVPVYVDVREIDGRVAALRADSCAELLVGSLFTD